jgi:hypothetical protein
VKHLLPVCDEATTRKVFGRYEYKPYVPEALEARGRFVATRNGALLPSLRWCLKTNYRRHPTAIVRIMAEAMASVIVHGKGRIPDQGGRHALIHSAWTGGYYNWLTESMPRALKLKRTFREAVPLLPMKSYFGYKEALHSLGFNDVGYFPTGRNAVLDDPIVTTCPPQFGTTEPAALQDVRTAVLEHYGLANNTPSEIVYVSRRKSRGRLVVNEPAVEAALERLGATCLCFEDLSFEQQVELMSRTRCLISIKGAGLTNMMFMPAGGAVIELLPHRNGIFDYGRARMSFLHDPCYLRLSAAMQHQYGYLLCAHDAKWWQATQMSNIEVDVEGLVALIRSAGPKT